MAAFSRHFQPVVPTTVHARPRFFSQFRIWGSSIEDVLRDPRWQGLARDLDVVELESGVEAVTRAARNRGHRAQPFDVKRDSVAENLLLEAGFHNAISLVMRIRPGGLLGQAPVCSSFVGLNVANTKRGRDNWAGDEQYPAVVAGSRRADITFSLMGLALARGVHTYLENPVGSMIFSYGLTTSGRPESTSGRQESPAGADDSQAGADDSLGVLRELPFLARSIQDRCCFTDHEKHTVFKKGYKFLTDGPWLPDTKCSCLAGAHETLVRTTVRRGGRPPQYSGNREALRQSQSYPDALGDFIIESWERIVAPVPRLEGSASRSGEPGKIAGARNASLRVETSGQGWAVVAEDPWASAQGADSPSSRPRSSRPKARPVPRHLKHLLQSLPAAKTFKVGQSSDFEDPWPETDSWEQGLTTCSTGSVTPAGTDADPWGDAPWAEPPGFAAAAADPWGAQAW